MQTTIVVRTALGHGVLVGGTRHELGVGLLQAHLQALLVRLAQVAGGSEGEGDTGIGVLGVEVELRLQAGRPGVQSALELVQVGALVRAGGGARLLQVAVDLPQALVDLGQELGVGR